MKLDERRRHRIEPAGTERPRAAATGAGAPFLVAEGDDDQRPLALPQKLDRLQPCDNSERAVETATVRHGVEMGAGPHLGQLRPPAA